MNENRQKPSAKKVLLMTLVVIAVLIAIGFVSEQLHLPR